MMTSSRRQFLACGGALLTNALLTPSTVHAADDHPQGELVVAATHAGQLFGLRFDPATGKLALPGPVADGLKPTWAVMHPRFPLLYAVDDDKAKGGVTAFAVDRATGALSRSATVDAGGTGTTYLWLDVPSSTLLAANYGTGTVASIALAADGRPGPLVSTVQDSGSGPNKRQASPHAHAVAVDPSGRYVLVPDLGADRVFVYGFDRATRKLTPDDPAAPRSWVAPAGSGPRHLAFGADGRHAYLMSELAATITVLRWDAREGRLTGVQTLPLSSPGFTGTPSGAEIAVSRDGRHVYASDRAEHALLVYGVRPETGELALAQRVPAVGEVPWGFALHPSGRWLLVANERSNKVAVFAVDPATGMLAASGQAVEVPAPVSITFAG